MLTPEQLRQLPTELTDIYSELTEFILRDIARRIADGAKITDTAEYQMYRARSLGLSTKEITDRISEINGMAADKTEQLIRAAAESSDEFDRRMLGADNGAAVPLSENKQLQKLLSAQIAETCGRCENFTNTLGFADHDLLGRVYYLSLTDMYRRELDSAHMKVVTGAADYTSAIRQAINKLAASGVRTIDYESGVSRTLEAAVRTALMTSVSHITRRISEQNAEDFGADGWEMSAHAGARPSHAVYQGRQYTQAEYESKIRPLISEPNCRHDVYPIIMGVTNPAYTDEELQSIDPPPFTYEGKEYTAYTAQQQMRKMERAMRRQKNRCIVADAAGDKESFTAASIKLRRQKDAYEDFAKAAGCYTEYERTIVGGYDRHLAGKTGAVTRKQRAFEKAQIRLTDGDGGGIINKNERKMQFLEELKNGKINTALDVNNQKKHIISPEWKNNVKQQMKKFHAGDFKAPSPKSRLNNGVDPIELFKKYSGTGEIKFQKNSSTVDEFVTADYPIGITFDRKRKKYVKTRRFQIRYQDGGYHLFPVIEIGDDKS